MHIANIESFKAWLVTNIRPICDADPYPLSKYVLALIKKDKDEKELKSICNDQLDVFFQENTLDFVEKLFQVLKDESYLKALPATAAAAPVTAPATAPAADSSTTPAASSASSADTANSPQKQQKSQPSDQTQHAPAIKRKASTSADSEKQQQQQQPSESKISRISIVKQSSDQKTAASSTTASSSNSLQPSSSSATKDLRSTINARAASSRHHQPPPTQQHQMPAATVQQSPMVSGGFQSVSGPLPYLPPPLPPPPHMMSMPSMPPPTHPHQPPLPPASSAGFYPPPMPMMLPPQQQQPQHRPRCRDYDEKGVCLLGAACPYDHGAHPMTMTPSDPNYGKFFPPGMLPPPPPSQMSIVPTGSGPGQVFSAAAMQVTAPSQPVVTQPQLQHHLSSHHLEGDGTASQLVPPQRIVQPPPPSKSSVVTVVAGNTKSNNGARVSQQQQQQQQQPSQSCTLELRRIPSSLNNADTLLEHFCKFGTIVDVDIGGCGSADSAKITFANASDALAAYRSPEAVLNNRFIRMFLPGASGGGGAPRVSAKDRLGVKQQQNAQRRHSNPRRVSTGDGDSGGDASADAGAPLSSGDSGGAPAPPSRAALTWTPHSAEAAAKAAEAAANAAAERKQESVRILQAQKVALERAKAHKELRAKQIRMLKDCKESLAKLGTLFAKAKDSESRHSIAETMKPINAQIRDLEASLGVVATGNASLRDLQKELLDLELEVFQKEGLEPVTDQKKRLAEVRKLLAARLPQKPLMPSAATSSALSSSAASTSLSGSTGGTAGVGQGASGAAAGGGGLPNFAQTRLDKRSKSLRVQGQPADKVDDLLRTLASQAGVKVQRHHLISSGPPGAQQQQQQQLLLDFASRAEAEVALAKLKSLAEERPAGFKAEWSQRTAAEAAAAAAAPPPTPAASSS